MVHALEECRRVLRPRGLLIDLRPLGGDWPLDLAPVEGRPWQLGRMAGLEKRLLDRAAAAALRAATGAGWFQPVRGAAFTFAWYWDNLAELETYLAERWMDVMALPAPTRAAAAHALAAAGPSARLRIRRGMRLVVYRRLGGEKF